MFRLALSSHIYLFLFETPIVTLWSPCAPEHVLWQRVFRGACEFKVRTWYSNGSFAIYVRWLFGWRYISSLHSADEPQEGRNSCPLLRSCFSGSCNVGVSKRFSRSINPAVANEAFCLKYKEIEIKEHWSSLVRVERWGWDSAETLLPITQPHEGGWGGAETGEHFSPIIF